MGGFERIEFFENYFDYVIEAAESPLIYHRWAMLTAASSLINRKVFLPFGHKNIYPNFYTVLIGNAATRKSTAIVMANELVQMAGQKRIISDRLDRISLIEDLAGKIDAHIWGEASSIEDLIEIDMVPSVSSDALIVASELENVIGLRNTDLISALTDFWDCPNGPLKLPRSSKLEPPKNIFISLLGGSTISTFNRMFPADIISQGTLSRLLLIYCSNKREKITWPKIPSIEATEKIVSHLVAMRSLHGEMKVSDEAKHMIDQIYREQDNKIEDYRFDHYNERRLDHLLRLCIMVACFDLQMEISTNHVMYANSMLKFAEKFMPIALGEFGDNEVSKIAYRLLTFVRASKTGIEQSVLMNTLKTDLPHADKIIDAIYLLEKTEKIQRKVLNQTVYLIPLSSEKLQADEFTQFDLLREFFETPNTEIEFAGEEDVEMPDPEKMLAEMKKLSEAESPTGDNNVVKFKF